LFIGRTKRCSRNWLCLFGDGYRRRCRSGVEWGAIFGKEKLQGSGGKNTTRFWEPHAIGAP